MSILSNPSSVSSGLVFNYDMNNNKSYRSPPIQNILNQITPRGLGTGTFYSFISGTENVYVPSLGWIENCKYVDMYNDYNGVPGSSNCCPSPFGYGDGLVVSPSTLYTYGIVYKSTNGYTHPNYMYHYELTSGGTYITEFGVFGNNGTTTKIRALGDDWYWASSTFTSNVSAGLMNTGSWMYEYGRYNRFHVAKVMLVPGNYIDMHPSLWPALGTTVTNTQAILDLTNNNTVTASSLTYASDGTFSFNGSSNWIELPTSSVFDSQNITMESWNKPTTTSQSGFLFEKGQVNTQYSNFYNSDGTFYFRTIGLTPQDLTFTAATHITAGQWNHIVCTVGAGVKTVYINGIQRYQQTGVTGTMPTGQTNQYIGKYGNAGNNYPFNGQISISKVYNRALLAEEVLQNFNAHKGRYGL